MQVELSKEQLEVIGGWGLHAQNTDGWWSVEDQQVFDLVYQVVAEAEELESIDLNDCAGGACKL